jgi:aryl-alcohol dehydrogenase-like predicted oxidoreductase
MRMSVNLTRRQFTIAGALACLASPGLAQTSTVLTRAIPITGEELPAVGLGTARIFDANDEEIRGKAAAVLRALIAGGGRLVDTASSYGDAESVLGETIVPAGLRDKIFLATKLEAPDAAELKRSQRRLQMQRFDLLQLHNVRDPRQSLARFRDWKAQGLCRYIGITSTSHYDFPAVEAVLRREKPDFVQIDYSLADREAEKRVLPAAAEVKAAVLTAEPLGVGRLFRAVRGKTVPDWAQGFAENWSQFFLKFLLGDPRVTAVIPGTADPTHMADNLGAMRGPLPDPDQRKKMEALGVSL